MFKVAIDTVAVDTSRRAGIHGDSRTFVLADHVVLNGDLRWFSDTDAAALVAMDTVFADNETFVRTEVYSMSAVLVDDIFINFGVIFVGFWT